jgi:hypothetical protein
VFTIAVREYDFSRPSGACSHIPSLRTHGLRRGLYSPFGAGRSSYLSLGVGEEGHEAEVHVELLVAVEEG